MKMKSSNRSRMNGARNGVATVEFALVFPIIMTFFIGMIVMTQAYLLRDMAQHAAYEGVRKGILLNAEAADAVSGSELFLQAMSIKGATVTTEPTVFESNTREITVIIDIPMEQNAWIAAPFLPETWNISSQVTIAKRVE